MTNKITIRTVLVVFLLSVIFIFNLTKISDPDFFWHLKTGEKILYSGSQQRYDSYSWTFPGEKWQNHEWLSQVIFYVLYRSYGFGALILLKALFITGAFFFVFLTLSACSSFEVSVFISSIVGWLSAVTYSIRPQLFSFFLLAALLFILLAKKRNKIILIVLPALFLLWINLHGLFIVGLAVLAVFAGEEAVKNKKPGMLAAAFFLSAVAAVINPWGLKGLILPFRYLAGGTHIHTNYIMEWLSPDFHEFYGKILFFYILLTCLAFAFSKKRLTYRDALLHSVFLFLALYSARNIPLFLIISAPAAASHFHSSLGGMLDKIQNGTRAFVKNSRILGALNYFLTASAIGFILLTYKTNFIDGFILENEFPAAKTMSAVKKLKPEKLLADYHWGGYLIFNDIPVFIDGRADFYPGKFLEDFFLYTHLLKNPEEFLKKYGFDCILWEKDSPFSFYLQNSDNWKMQDSDGVAAVFTRR